VTTKSVPLPRPSIERGPSLRSRPRQSATEARFKARLAVMGSESDQVFPQNLAGVEAWSSATYEDRATSMQLSGSNQSSSVGGMRTPDKDKRIMAPPHLSAASFVAHAASNSFDSRAAVRRRLGVTGRMSRPPDSTKHHFHGLGDVKVSICPVDAATISTQPSVEDVRGTRSSVTLSPTQLDRSFTKLVEGLHRIPRRHRDDNKVVATAAVQQAAQNCHRRSHRSSPTPSHTGSRSRRTDHDRPGSEEDGGLIRVESGNVRSLVKDCVVALQRSQCIEKMVKVAASETKIFSHMVSANKSNKTLSLLASTSSSPSSFSSSSLLASAAVRCDQPRHRLSLRKSPRSDSNSSSPWKDTISNNVHIDRETNLSTYHILANDSNSIGRESMQVSVVPKYANIRDIDDSRCNISPEISAMTGRRRLKRRKVGLQLTGSESSDRGHGFGTDEDPCIVGQNMPDLDRRTAIEADVGQKEVTSPQPDPDFSLSGYGRSVCEKAVAFNTHVGSYLVPVTQLKDSTGSEAKVMLQPEADFSPSRSVMKCAKTALVNWSEVTVQPDPDFKPLAETTSIESDEDRDVIGRSEFTLQSYRNFPSSATSVKCAEATVVSISHSDVLPQTNVDLLSSAPVRCVSTNNGETSVGHAEVMLESDPDCFRPDPDLSQQPADATDFSSDLCTDVMYRLALFSSPETSDPDSSPPNPSSPTDSFPGESQIRQPVFDQPVGSADKYLTDLKVTGTLSTKSCQSKVDFVCHTSDHSGNMLSSPSITTMISAQRKSWDEQDDFVRESDLAAEENAMVMARDVEESSSPTDDNGVDLVRCVDVTQKNSDPTPAFDEPLNRVNNSNDDEQMNQSKNLTLDVAENADVGNGEIGSTREESSLRMASCAMEESLSNSRNAVSDFVDHNDIRNDGISSMASESKLLGESATDTIEDVVVLRPESLPPSRHEVLFELASSSRNSLLQSARDAFCSDARDLPSHPRYVVTWGIYSIMHHNVTQLNCCIC